MQEHDLDDMLKKALALISAMQRREDSLRNLLNTELARLHRSVEGVDGRIGRVIDTAPEEVANRVGPALDRIAKQLDERLAESSRHFSDAADRYDKAHDNKVAALQKRVTWMGAAMAVLSLLMLGSVVYFASANRHLVDERQRLQKEVQWLDKVNRADIVPCGEGLCANVDMSPEPIGDKQQYRQVRPR